VILSVVSKIPPWSIAMSTTTEPSFICVNTIMSNPLNIENAVKESDLVIGAVLIPGAKAPSLVTEDMIKQMKDGSVVVDIAIDQGHHV
jgi:alanine dehydrogenase